MRRVLKHHVCLCVLSTAVLAGLALSTAQEVYAQSQNCNGVASPGGSGGDERIECDGSSGKKTLEGARTINMGKEPGEPAVKVYGGADITISSEPLKITGDGGNSSPAIKVESGGKLRVMNVTATNVYKGIEAEDGGSVTVLQGSI
ncbi:hypothetical protein, partial [Bartonella schoenbuchensis]|uniref:hypothetical protein n=1 Tax=Bartonella schoenbuchensis TaxID=165694 RepID=UPI001ABA5DCC